MLAGKLRHKIIIQASTASSVDTYGGVTMPYTSSFATYAAIKEKENIYQNEAMDKNLNAKNAVVKYLFTIRYDSRITTRNRVYFGGRIFEILGVLNNDARNISQTLICKETP